MNSEPRLARPLHRLGENLASAPGDAVEKARAFPPQREEVVAAILARPDRRAARIQRAPGLGENLRRDPDAVAPDRRDLSKTQRKRRRERPLQPHAEPALRLRQESHRPHPAKPAQPCFDFHALFRRIVHHHQLRIVRQPPHHLRDQQPVNLRRALRPERRREPRLHTARLRPFEEKEDRAHRPAIEQVAQSKIQRFARLFH